MIESAIIRLFVSQAFLCYYLLVLIPLRKPIKQNTIKIIVGVLIITLLNAFMITHLGLFSFYIRFFFITLLIPNILLYNYFAVYKGAKLLFAFLSVQVFGNVAIMNGVLASYLINGVDNPLADTVARILTFGFFLPVIYKLVRVQYGNMVKTLNKGWWVLNFILITSYALTYYIGFVPTPILYRHEYFIHAYIGIILSLLIYVVIFLLFIEIQFKVNAELDKQLLSIQVTSLEAQSAAISASEEKINILKHDMRHHLSIIEEQIKTGDFQQAAILLQHLELDLADHNHPVYCKNKVINAALTHYLGYALKHKIAIDAHLDVPETLSINSAELAIVFANAVENAIHACMKIDDVAKRSITLISRYTKGSLFLEISNPCFEEVVFKDSGQPITLVSNHGTGVLSMMAFAKKNHAILDFSLENNTFVLRLLLHSV